MDGSRVKAGKGAKGTTPLQFEDALKRLEEVVGNLEAESVSLEESLALFEEGIRLAELCRSKLAAAELRMLELAEKGGGEIGEKPIE